MQKLSQIPVNIGQKLPPPCCFTPDSSRSATPLRLRYRTGISPPSAAKAPSFAVAASENVGLPRKNGQ